MNRRRFLAGASGSLIAATSGCLGDDVVFSRGNSEPPAMTLSLSAVDDDPEPLSFEIDLLDDQLTEASVPTMDIAVENNGDESATWSYAGGISNLPFPQGTHSGARELVIGLEDTVQAQLLDTSDGCARVEYFTSADGIQTTRLEPAETIGERYVVGGVDGNLEGVCPEPGSYRMQYDFGEYGEWGFEVQLE